MADTSIPCIPFPKAKTLSVPTPFGPEIKSLVNLAGGPPTDCDLAHSLMIQLTPMLAGLTCLVRMLKVAESVKGLIDSGPDPFSLVDGLINDVAPALDELSKCFAVFNPCALAQLISGILEVVLSYLRCLIGSFESIWNLRAGIDLDAAGDNPVLLASLQCADANAASSMASLSDALEGIQPLLSLANPLLEIIGVEPLDLSQMELSTPSLADLAPGQDPLEGVKAFVDVLQNAKNVVDAVC